MLPQALPASPSPIAGAACVFEGGAAAVPFDQLPEAIRLDLIKHAPGMWVAGPKFDPSEKNFMSPIRFMAAARLDQRYVVAIEHDGWSYNVSLLTYDMSASEITPKAERSTERKPTCRDMAEALTARLYPQARPLIP